MEDKILQLKKKREDLMLLQQTIKSEKLPVFVLVEGWGASGKGTLISYLIRDLDPRFFDVIPTKTATEEECRKPFLWRHMKNIPEQGKFVFLDSGWMNEVVTEKIEKDRSKSWYESRIESVNMFERQLVDNGYLVLKIFLDISKKEQEKRINKLVDSKNTRWRVSEEELSQVKNHKEYDKAFKKYIKDTDTKACPWNIIDMGTEKEVELEVCTLLTDGIENAVKNNKEASKGIEKEFPMLDMPKLDEVSLNCSISQETYEEELKACKKKLQKLHNKLYRHGIPVVIGYEGWDAAGKGGNIKRLTSGLDARGFEVHPIAAPEPHELKRHYLWRFWDRLPKTGHIAIFDRTWYGRVMVERLEGFCAENDWKRAYTEINEFEKELSDWGAVVMKFWIHIDKDTQLARFNLRQNTPEKRWKITDEDWRNREKWDQYEEAVNEMIQKTSTKNAPWHIIESNDKYFARIKVMHLVIEALEAKVAQLSD